MTGLAGKVAIVTGASRGIGAAVARAYAQGGASVGFAARDEAALDRLAGELSDAGSVAITVPTDVTDAHAVARMVDRVVSYLGQLDFACNNAAGGGHPPTPLAQVPVESFDSGIATSLRGAFLAMKYEIPAMLRNGGGVIVNMSSTAGIQGVGGLAAYVSAKHGLQGLTRVAALDYAGRGVRVNGNAPGPILTDNLARAGSAAQQAAAAAMPMQRVGSTRRGRRRGRLVVFGGRRIHDRYHRRHRRRQARRNPAVPDATEARLIRVAASTPGCMGCGS